MSEYKIENLSTAPSLQAAASVTQNMMSVSTELVLFSNNNMLSLSTLTPSVSSLLPFNTNTIIQGIMKWIFIAVGALGLFNNLIVMAVVLKVKKLNQQPRNWFIFYQSLADFINAIFIIAVANRAALPKLNGVVGDIVCVLWVSNALYHATSLASSYILAAFTIEIYMAIAHPVTHKKVFSQRLVTLMVIVAWFIGFTYPLGTYIGIARVMNGVCYPSYAWLPVAIPMSIVNFLFKMAIPMILFATFYVMTFVSLRRKVRLTMPTMMTTTSKLTVEKKRKPTNKTASKSHYTQASHNVAMTVMYTLILHVMSWTGNQVNIIMGTFGSPVDVSSLLYQIFLLAIYSNSCVNPIVYAIKYRQFRRALLQVIQCVINKKQKQSSKGHVSRVDAKTSDAV